MSTRIDCHYVNKHMKFDRFLSGCKNEVSDEKLYFFICTFNMTDFFLAVKLEKK